MLAWPVLHCYNEFCDWLNNLASLSWLVRMTCVFLWLAPAMWICSEFWLIHWIFCLGCDCQINDLSLGSTTLNLKLLLYHMWLVEKYLANISGSCSPMFPGLGHLAHVIVLSFHWLINIALSQLLWLAWEFGRIQVLTFCLNCGWHSININGKHCANAVWTNSARTVWVDAFDKQKTQKQC